jgi:hypothetical protein
MRRTATACLTALLVSLTLSATPALAREILVRVTSISASMLPDDARAAGETEVQFDPRLRPYSKNLRSLFAYERYEFIRRDEFAVEPGAALPFQLPEHFSLEVAPEELKPGGSDLIEMTITLYRDVSQRPGRREGRDPETEVILRTKIRLKNGGTVLLGGPPIRSGVLVMALSARG